MVNYKRRGFCKQTVLSDLPSNTSIARYKWNAGVVFKRTDSPQFKPLDGRTFAPSAAPSAAPSTAPTRLLPPDSNSTQNENAHQMVISASRQGERHSKQKKPKCHSFSQVFKFKSMLARSCVNVRSMTSSESHCVKLCESVLKAQCSSVKGESMMCRVVKECAVRGR